LIDKAYYDEHLPRKDPSACHNITKLISHTKYYLFNRRAHSAEKDFTSCGEHEARDKDKLLRRQPQRLPEDGFSCVMEGIRDAEKACQVLPGPWIDLSRR
jgi:hypothetical protein